MASHFCLSILPLDIAFHGRGDGGMPEWPPSPLRVFQSLVAAAARRGSKQELVPPALEALTWLETLQAPIIIAPLSSEGTAYCLSVPNNAMDIVGNAWARGNESNSGDANPATHRTLKQFRSTWMPDKTAIHYLWLLPDAEDERVHQCMGFIAETARSIVTVGWGIDMAVGHARVVSDPDMAALAGERWTPQGRAANGLGLRVPKSGSLKELIHRHDAFLSRLQTDRKGQLRLVPPAPATVFSTIEYRTAAEPQRIPVAAFSLARIDGKGFCAFDPARRALSIAGMARYATEIRAQSAGWDERKIARLVLGHGEIKGQRHVSVDAERFVYLPLPSIEARGDSTRRQGPIRRLLVSIPTSGYQDEIDWVRRSLSGHELIDSRKKMPVAVLSPVPVGDVMVRYYTRPATTWATVTPVILPGFDDPAHYRRRLKRGVTAQEQLSLLYRLNQRIDDLVRKAIGQAGFSQELAENAEIEWSKVSFWTGGNLADCYGVPDHLKRFPRFHVKIRWQNGKSQPIAVPGPICIGGGRFCGLGLLAAM